MPDLTATGFQNTRTLLGGQTLVLESILTPYFPALQYRPDLEFLQPRGVTGWRTRLRGHTPRTVDVSGITGAAGGVAAQKLARDWEGIDGSYGRITWAQGGASSTIDLAQIFDVRTELTKATHYRGDGTSVSDIVTVRFTLAGII